MKYLKEGDGAFLEILSHLCGAGDKAFFEILPLFWSG